MSNDVMEEYMKALSRVLSRHFGEVKMYKYTVQLYTVALTIELGNDGGNQAQGESVVTCWGRRTMAAKQVQ